MHWLLRLPWTEIFGLLGERSNKRPSWWTNRQRHTLRGQPECPLAAVRAAGRGLINTASGSFDWSCGSDRSRPAPSDNSVARRRRQSKRRPCRGPHDSPSCPFQERQDMFECQWHIKSENLFVGEACVRKPARFGIGKLGPIKCRNLAQKQCWWSHGMEGAGSRLRSLRAVE